MTRDIFPSEVIPTTSILRTAWPLTKGNDSIFLSLPNDKIPSLSALTAVSVSTETL